MLDEQISHLIQQLMSIELQNKEKTERAAAESLKAQEMTQRSLETFGET